MFSALPVRGGVRIRPRAIPFARLCCLNDRFDQSHSQSAVLQLQNAVDRTPGRRGYGVFQLCRMLSGLEHHCTSAQHRLCRKLGRDVARQSYLDSGFCKRLDYDVNEGRSASR